MANHQNKKSETGKVKLGNPEEARPEKEHVVGKVAQVDDQSIISGTQDRKTFHSGKVDENAAQIKSKS